MKQLTIEQRYTIQTLLTEDYSPLRISEIVQCSIWTIRREIKRNINIKTNRYEADNAQEKTNERHREKHKFIRFTNNIKQRVTSLLKEDYSPEQIVGRCKQDGHSCVSHESIYKEIWHDKAQGGDLYKHLRTQGKRYTSRDLKYSKRGQIVGRIGIEHRPEVVEEKKRLGDLEMDLIIGADHKGAIITINDRAAGMLKMKKLDCKGAQYIKEAALSLLEEWKPILHTITTDNGKEFAAHKEIAESLNIDFYFATPYHSWERGANENLNGLIRQYFPKKTNFMLIKDEEILTVQNKLNNRPRKRFMYLTPNEVFKRALLNNQKVHL
jgi:transposase, IS30 family